MIRTGAVPARAIWVSKGSEAHGAHLMLWRQRILGQTAMAVPSHFLPVGAAPISSFPRKREPSKQFNRPDGRQEWQAGSLGSNRGR